MKIYFSFDAENKTSSRLVEKLKMLISKYDIEVLNPTLSTGYGEVHKNIISEVYQSDLVIGMISQYSANVMYELGVSCGMNKNLIIIGDISCIPNELKKYRYISEDSNIYSILKVILEALDDKKDVFDKYRKEKEHTIRFYSKFLSGKRPIVRKRVLSEYEWLSSVKLCDSRVFEERICERLEKIGYEIDKRDDDRDVGYDFLLSPFKNSCAAVELKCYKSDTRVSIETAVSILSAMTTKNITYGIIFTTVELSESAKHFIDSTNKFIAYIKINDMNMIDKIRRNDVENAFSKKERLSM